MRTGLIAKKMGMTQFFLEDGTRVAVTALKVDPCTVVGIRSLADHGYEAVQLGVDPVSSSRLSNPMRGHFEKQGLPFFKKTKEFPVSGELPALGTVLTAAHFQSGQCIDVTGITIGKGFAGSMKRHNFGGLRASHGVSVSHRSHGSTGNRQDPGKVFKNKKMAGHMGVVRVTSLNLVIHQVDEENHVVFVRGAVPGSVGGTVYIRDAIKKKLLSA